MTDPVRFAKVDWRGRTVSIEYTWVGSNASEHPPLIFLHEGLGSLSMWRDFPQRLCEAAGLRGLVFSRPAYGRSTPRPLDEHWAPDFLHQQAHEVLPALLKALRIEHSVWLFGHSDGGSIALLFASRFPRATAGIVLLAPHVFVEDLSVSSIEQTRRAFLETDLPQKLARHHDNVESAFWGWNHIWLDPGFRAWNIEREIEAIGCPVLAVQGIGDEYGTLEQVRSIRRHVPQTRLLELPECGHSPHRDQPERVIAETRTFITTRRPA
jgi:pimeloyl-ACP methyl ester carboxylesterase